MKPREQRQKVLIRARMRSDSGWSEACILNLSKRGLLVQAPHAPTRGTYVEIHRGSYCVVARVMWSKHHRFGVRSQDLLVVERLLGEAAPAVPATRVAALANDRRAKPRTTAQQAERSRQRAQTFEFATAVIVGIGAAIAGFGVVAEVLGAPMRAISTALGPL